MKSLRPGFPVSCLWLAVAVGLGACERPTLDAQEADPAAEAPAEIEDAGATQDANAAIAAAVPANDIYLVPLEADGSVRLHVEPRNATRRAGYDNQPGWLPDSSGFLYASIRDGRQSDVFRYDLAANASEQVTATAESEYSPTPRQDGGFTVVRVEEDGRQRLWRLHAKEPARPVLPEQTGVGYHAWLSDHRVALFIVGEPHRLIVADTRDGSSTEVAAAIGRGLAADPETGALTFAVVDPERGSGEVRQYAVADGQTATLAPTVAAGEDFAWGQNGTLYMAGGRQLHAWQAGSWRSLADWRDTLPGDISRLAVSPDGAWLALVVAEAGAQ